MGKHKQVEVEATDTWMKFQELKMQVFVILVAFLVLEAKGGEAGKPSIPEILPADSRAAAWPIQEFINASIASLRAELKAEMAQIKTGQAATESSVSSVS